MVRGSGLLGIIIAVYEKEPYVHMLPIGQIFHDISRELQAEVGLPGSRICCGLPFQTQQGKNDNIKPIIFDHRPSPKDTPQSARDLDEEGEQSDRDLDEEGEQSDRRASTGASRDSWPLNIDNPLGICSRAEREEKISKFIDLDDGLKEYSELLRRGAILAAGRDHRVIYEDDQDGKNLSLVQKHYLQNETKYGPLKQSKALFGSLLSTCLAGMIQ